MLPESSKLVLVAPIGADGTLGSFQATTPLPARSSLAGVVAYNGFFYLLGGRAFGAADPAATYFAPIKADGMLGAFTSTTRLLQPTSDMATAVVNGFVVMCGGFAPSFGTPSRPRTARRTRRPPASTRPSGR